MSPRLLRPRAPTTEETSDREAAVVIAADARTTAQGEIRLPAVDSLDADAPAADGDACYRSQG